VQSAPGGCDGRSAPATGALWAFNPGLRGLNPASHSGVIVSHVSRPHTCGLDDRCGGRCRRGGLLGCFGCAPVAVGAQRPTPARQRSLRARGSAAILAIPTAS
jgi:hypothetical protein